MSRHDWAPTFSKRSINPAGRPIASSLIWGSIVHGVDTDRGLGFDKVSALCDEAGDLERSIVAVSMFSLRRLMASVPRQAKLLARVTDSLALVALCADRRVFNWAFPGLALPKVASLTPAASPEATAVTSFYKVRTTESREAKSRTSPRVPQADLLGKFCRLWDLQRTPRPCQKTPKVSLGNGRHEPSRKSKTKDPT